MKFVCILFFISHSLMASSLEKVSSFLPQDVKQLSLQKTSPKDAEKILGRADVVRGKAYYWERDGFKYSLELVFDNNDKLTSYHYTFSDKHPKFDSYDEKKLVPTGKYFRYTENNVELTVDPVNRTIRSVKIR